MNNQAFFNKKTIVTFLLSILVVMIHVNAFSLYDINTTSIGGRALYCISLVLESGVTSVAIRLFFLISGVLFYRNYCYRNTLAKYKSRVKSLLVPYLIWCTLYTFAVILLHYTPLASQFEFDVPFTFKNLIMGIFFNDFYSSFWFIFNLMLFTLFCPVFYTLLKNKWVGAVVILTLIVLYAFGITIPEMITINGIEYVAFWRADSIILYMIGAYIGIHFYDWFSKKKDKKFSLACAFIVVLMIVLQTIKEYISLSPIINLLSLIVYSLSLWFAFDIFQFDKKPNRIFEYSFMTFALNFYMGILIPRLLYYILPKAPIFALFNFVISSIIIVAVIIGVSYFLDKKLHKIYTTITGGR